MSIKHINQPSLVVVLTGSLSIQDRVLQVNGTPSGYDGKVVVAVVVDQVTYTLKLLVFCSHPSLGIHQEKMLRLSIQHPAEYVLAGRRRALPH